MDDAMDEMLSVDAAAAALGVDPSRLGGAPLTGGGLSDGGMAAPAAPSTAILDGDVAGEITQEPPASQTQTPEQPPQADPAGQS